MKKAWALWLLWALAILPHIVLLCEQFRGSSLDPAKLGQFGDFVGGYAGTFAIFLSVYLVLKSYEDQKRTNERGSFEGRFFELLRYHRENVDELRVKHLTGRRVFVSMIREFREVLEIVIELSKSKKISADPQPEMAEIQLAYLAFYYGVGPNSTRVFESSVPEPFYDEFVQSLTKEMESIQRKFNDLPTEHSEVDRRRITRLDYRPFDGHQSRLGHYYRHLYQTVKYVASHAPVDLATKKVKHSSLRRGREYVDILRAQLSNHEQAILCLNAISPLGKAWTNEGFIEDFEFIKNIPLDFFSESELNLEAEFPKIKFESSRLESM
ncbi:MAG: putative phage abortive infection protein [Planctomyces sp.]|nr:putative phage abortive infection protein [Planctomyces sp.]